MLVLENAGNAWLMVIMQMPVSWVVVTGQGKGRQGDRYAGRERAGSPVMGGMGGVGGRYNCPLH